MSVEVLPMWEAPDDGTVIVAGLGVNLYYVKYHNEAWRTCIDDGSMIGSSIRHPVGFFHKDVYMRNPSEHEDALRDFIKARKGVYSA